MTSASFDAHSKVVATRGEGAPSQAEIERQITKLKEDSTRDVERQLAQQRLASREAEVKAGVKHVAEAVEKEFAPAWKAAEQDVETIVEDAEADVKSVRRLHRAAGTEVDDN